MSQHPAFSSNNVAVITGAADGIGAAAAEQFARFGMNVVMADIESEKLEAATSRVKSTAGSSDAAIVYRTVDVSKFDEVCELRDHAMSLYGRVDVLMNNAGTSQKTTSWGELDHWRHLIGVNMWGIIHGIQAFAETMIEQGSPALMINTGSKQGITNPPGNPAYNVSKAGVKAATESLQHALRNTEDCQLSAHLLVPGFTYTGLIKRFVSEKPDGAWQPEEVVDYMLAAIDRGSFYIICPDNEVSSVEDSRRIIWGAGDLAYDRPPLSRWDEDFDEAFRAFSLDD
ncbi:MAG: SDR family NAD(P)-dependent oxidoreductase [Gammaproteobacteria bacterium]